MGRMLSENVKALESFSAGSNSTEGDLRLSVPGV